MAIDSLAAMYDPERPMRRPRMRPRLTPPGVPPQPPLENLVPDAGGPPQVGPQPPLPPDAAAPMGFPDPTSDDEWRSGFERFNQGYGGEGWSAPQGISPELLADYTKWADLRKQVAAGRPRRQVPGVQPRQPGRRSMVAPEPGGMDGPSAPMASGWRGSPIDPREIPAGPGERMVGGGPMPLPPRSMGGGPQPREIPAAPRAKDIRRRTMVDQKKGKRPRIK